MNAAVLTFTQSTGYPPKKLQIFNLNFNNLWSVFFTHPVYCQVLLCGLRRFDGSCVRAGLSSASVQMISLLCWKLELGRCSQVSRRVRSWTEKMLTRFRYSEDKSSQLMNIVRSAHQSIQWQTIQAKTGYKTINIYS